MDRQAIVDATGEDDNARIFKIQITNKSITAIAPLRDYEKLRYLNLSYNLIEKIQNLHTLTDLRELHLENNAISKIAALENNKNLQVLNLANNRIERIENIAHLIKLETLILDSNSIAKLTGLEYLKELKTLAVSKNSLDSLDSLPTFSRLTTLLLSHNNIKKISTELFISSKALIVLDLSHNKIVKTRFLRNLGSLEQLDLSHNCIQQLDLVDMEKEEKPTQEKPVQEKPTKEEGVRQPIKQKIEYPLPNLESLNLSHNEIDKLQSIASLFPELISLDLSYNSLCSEVQLISALTEVSYLTELDFRENPMFSETFQSAIQKIHCFDFLNKKAMTKAGAKYCQQIADIRADLVKNQQFYELDEEPDGKYVSGFCDEQLEFQMSGYRPVRPHSPRKKRNFEKPTFYDDIDKGYHEFMKNDARIKSIREQYLKICGQYDIITSEHILTELPAESERPQRVISEEKIESNKRIEEPLHAISQQLQENYAQIRKENEKNLSKWKELKNREKSFKIRDVIKSRGRDNSVNRGHGSSTNTNWTNVSSTINANPKQEREKNELFKTQMLPRKKDELSKTLLRPNSMRKKE